jgi:hypothetical protein
MVDMETILVDDDQQRLNAMLQGVGYAIVCDDATVTVDEEHLLAGGAVGFMSIKAHVDLQRLTGLLRVEVWVSP